MAENTHFKKTYTAEEVQECFRWFDEHVDELPASLQLSPSMFIADLHTCVHQFVNKLRAQMESKPVYSGQFALLLMIREHLQKADEATPPASPAGGDIPE